jgi:hypothetical protein
MPAEDAPEKRLYRNPLDCAWQGTDEPADWVTFPSGMICVADHRNLTTPALLPGRP